VSEQEVFDAGGFGIEEEGVASGDPGARPSTSTMEAVVPWSSTWATMWSEKAWPRMPSTVKVWPGDDFRVH
jgi:hypothetical protein